MTSYKVRRAKPITGEITVPGDKSISHRAMMFAGLSHGSCRIEGFLPSEDCLATMECMKALGAQVTPDEASDLGFGPTAFDINGTNGRLTAPAAAIDCGNSGTTMRLMTGILAGQSFTSELTGDASLSKRPMGRVVTPLTQMGAHIETLGEGGCAPLRIHGRPLAPITYELPVASAQVKSAVLLAGLFAHDKTTVVQPVTTRDHTERMLRAFQVKLVHHDDAISIYGGQHLEGRDFNVPGDISSAAFWLVAAAAQPGAKLGLRNVGLNPTRTGILKVLVRMGAVISENASASDEEPVGHLEIKGAELQGTEIGGEEIPNIIDELPVLAVAGALAKGTTVIRDAQELKVKETDRLHAVITNLRAMGVEVEEFYDGMAITGVGNLRGTCLPSFGDHRIAMAFAIAGLFAQGETTIEDTACVNTSYPGFESVLKAFITGKSSL